MSLLCAVLLPTRGRVDKCVKCVESFDKAAHGRTDFEIVLRLDWDDEARQEYVYPLGSRPGIKIIIGPRYRGFKDFSRYITEAAKATNAPWIMQFNDDATIEGPWLDELDKVFSFETIVVCEWHKLGGSAYQYDWGGPFPILPNGFWKFLGLDQVPPVSDTDSVRGLKALGWPVHFLQGVSFHHQRDSDETLEAHRRL